MDLSTRWLGLELPHPFMPGASPLADDLDLVRRLEDAGAAAIVLRSLFEEQIEREQVGAEKFVQAPGDHAEAQSYFPATDVFALGPDEYLEQLRRIRAAVHVPVIASLNGATPGGWLSHAKSMEQAGAHALELNFYMLATEPTEGAEIVERRLVELVREVKAQVTLPVAVKLSPFFSALPNLAQRLVVAGADGLVLFNRFYQADIDIEQLEVTRSLHLSSPSELLVRLRWLAILYGRVTVPLAVSGGVHGPEDALKSLMAGASAVQMVSALLQHGPDHLRAVRAGVVRWMEAHEYESLAQLRGSMSHAKCPDPLAYERADYAAILQSWHRA